jgi:hypothetical protein
VGKLNHLFGRMRQPDQTWCCESCRKAAHARGHLVALMATDSAADPGREAATREKPLVPGP